MNLSIQSLELLQEELSEVFVPGRIQKVFDTLEGDLVFEIRAPGQTHLLLFSLKPQATRLHLILKKPDRPPRPTAWTMLLRKWIHGAWLEEIRAAHDDRILFFSLQAIDPNWEPADDEERAPRTALQLVFECFGSRPNAFLLKGTEILGVWRPEVQGDRPIASGRAYRRPTTPGIEAPDEIAQALTALPPDGRRSHHLREYYKEFLTSAKEEALRRSLNSTLKQEHKRARRLVANIEGDLNKIEDASDFRRFGELLQSAYGKIERGAKSARVPDYYAEGLPEVEIPLDPSRSLQENISRYFHQYRRFTEAKADVETRLLTAFEEVDRLETLRNTLKDLDTYEELELFNTRHQIVGAREASRGARKRTQQKNRGPLPPYRTFQGSRGATILVGRGSKQNDILTTSVARGRDLWLHARDWAGAHVLLRLEKNEEPHQEDLLDAAILAAFFSKGKADTSVDITYTRAKYVRKPPGSPPGLVTVADGSTLLVRLEEDRLQRILDTEVQSH